MQPQAENDTVIICVDLPPSIHSSGVWSDTISGVGGPTRNNSFFITDATLPLLEKQMALAFFTTQILHLFLRRFGIPVFVSQMLAGVILGPAIMGRIPSYSKLMFSIVGEDILGTLTLFGYAMFLFLAGVKMDFKIVFRTGKNALYSGIISFVVPFICGIVTIALLPKSWNLSADQKVGLTFLALTYSQTSFIVIACLLSELKLLTSELGRIVLSSAIVNDVLWLSLGSCVRLTFRSMKEVTASRPPAHSIRDGVALTAFLLTVVFLARPAMFWVIKHTPKGKHVHDGYLFLIFLLALCSGLLSWWFNQYIFFGPFVLGLAVPNGPPLGSALVHKYDFMVTQVFLPLFVTSSVLLTNPTHILGLSHNLAAMSNVIVLLVTLVAKFAANLFSALYCKMPLMDALAISVIMSCKGVAELACYVHLISLDDQTVSFSVMVVLLNAFIVPILVKRLYKPWRKYAGYEQRNITSLKQNAELRILACIHRHDNSAAVISLLDACCPTRDNPIALIVLHLIEMSGRAAPIFISHKMQKNKISDVSYWEDVLLSFVHLEREYCEAVTVQPFTAICPPEYMHENVCTLALDKLTSLIILPFHRHWGLDGSIQSQVQAERSLNSTLLEGAPCSVGILVNRGPLRHSSTLAKSQAGDEQGSHRSGTSSKSSASSSAAVHVQYRVALIFLGGEDDREALALTQRMVKDPNISVTVYYLTPTRKSANPNWDRILDLESLRKFRQDYIGNGSAFYNEEIAESGPQTVEILRAIVHKYDLFVVGRRRNGDSPQTSGLDEWSEFPELGIVGDMLASDDFGSRSSILVLQQQLKHK